MSVTDALLKLVDAFGALEAKMSALTARVEALETTTPVAQPVAEPSTTGSSAVSDSETLFDLDTMSGDYVQAGLPNDMRVAADEGKVIVVTFKDDYRRAIFSANDVRPEGTIRTYRNAGVNEVIIIVCDVGTTLGTLQPGETMVTTYANGAWVVA